MQSKLSILMLCIVTQLNATNFKLSEKNVHASHELGKVKLFHNNKDGFKVWRQGKMEKLPSECLSSELRTIDTKTLKEYQKHAYIRLSRDSQGSINASSTVRGTAGGPAACSAVYWLTKGAIFYLIGKTSEVIIDNVKGIKACDIVLKPEGQHPLNDAIDEGGLMGVAAVSLKAFATKGPMGLGGYEVAQAVDFGKGCLTKAALDNFNSPAVATGKLIGSHDASSFMFKNSPSLNGTVTGPAFTVKQLSTAASAGYAGHYVYKEGYLGNAGRAQWDSSMKSAASSITKNTLGGATIVLGTAAVEGASALGTLGWIECAAQSMAAWALTWPTP